MAETGYTISVWINDERFDKLQSSPVAGMVKEVFAGLKVIQVPVTEAQKDRILNQFPSAKCDTATTRTIELLPRAAKDLLFDLVAETRSAEVVDRFLKAVESRP